MSLGFVEMLSRWVAAIRHLARANLSLSEQGSSPGLWTVQSFPAGKKEFFLLTDCVLMFYSNELQMRVNFCRVRMDRALQKVHDTQNINN